MANIKRFNEFKSSNTDQAYSIINEGIFNFNQKASVTEVDTDQLNKIQNDVLSKYDLDDSDISNIRSKISDAISKKVNVNVDINNK